MIKTLDEVKISFTPEDGEKRMLTYEEKEEFIQKINSRIIPAFIVGIPFAKDGGQYKFENNPYDKN